MKPTVFIFLIVLLLGSCKKETPIEPINADFTWDELPISDGSVRFDQRCTGPVTSYSWSFGDGTSESSTQSLLLHKYPRNGTYSVTMVARADDGREKTAIKTVKVENIPTTGRFMFWTDVNGYGKISVYIQNVFVGQTTVYYSSGSPSNCGEGGNVTVTLPQGVYSYSAQSEGLFPLKWSGTIGIMNGQCQHLKLVRS